MAVYIDKEIGCNTFIRTFPIDIDDSELVWHRDRNDRIVSIKSGGGWQFQYDNELPFLLEKGMEISIKKGIYHRVLKGYDDLIITIIEE